VYPLITAGLTMIDAITPQTFAAPLTRRLWRSTVMVIDGIKTKRPHDVTACVVSVMVEPSGCIPVMKAARFYPGNFLIGIRSVNVAIMNLALENIIGFH